MSLKLILIFIIKILCLINANKLKDNLLERNKKRYINEKRKYFNNQKHLRKLTENYIRIYVDTSYLEQNIEKEDFDIYDYSLNKAKNTLEKLIKVDRETSPISISDVISSNKREGFFVGQLNQTFFNPGVNTDLLILVRMQSGTEFAKDCYEKPKILKYKNGNERERPIVGLIIISIQLSKSIDEDIKYKKELYSYIFLHQLTHILGFVKSTITNSNGKLSFNSKSRDRTSHNIVRTIISGTNLLQKARQYFNCSDLDGIEIEEIQFCEDEYIHWDARILSGEYMTCDINVQEQVISEFTLAFLQDTGFYEVNYFTGGLMRFGKNMGCRFFSDDCNEPLPTDKITGNTFRYSSFPNEFCSSKSKTTCTPGRIGKGICDNYIDSGSLTEGRPDYVRTNWPVDDNYGNRYADYCPISLSEKEIAQEGITNSNVYSYIGNCKIGKKDGYGAQAFSKSDLETFKNKNYDYSIFSDSYGETFGKNSFCAFSSVINKNDPKRNIYEGFIRPTCYEMYCSSKSLTIKINNKDNSQYIVCPRSGGYINIGGDYVGHLLCPDFNLICSQTILCNNMFDCTEIGSETKEDLNYNYNKVNVSMQILLPGPNTPFEKAYELSNDGECPINCSECNNYHQCFECNNNTPYYIGVEENDQNLIYCSSEIPIGYYHKDKSGKNYYYKCLDNCYYCNSADKCNGCSPDYKLDTNKKCQERIEGCGEYNETSSYNDEDTNGGYKGYKQCLKCNHIKNYYCINNQKETCVQLKDLNAYYDNKYGCKTKCEDSFQNCYRCDENKCIECKSNYHLNGKNCTINIPNCIDHNDFANPPECNRCNTSYYCLYGDKTKCTYVENINTYYIAEKDVCYKKCSEQFENNDKCINCTLGKCYDCEGIYFVYNDIYCLKGLEHCLKHFYNITHLLCEKCETNYYCIDNKKEICAYIPPEKKDFYYKIEDTDYSCVEKCSKKFSFCMKCNRSECSECAQYTKKNDNGKCVPDGGQFSSCAIKLHAINDDINEIEIDDFPYNYYPNLPSFNAIDHYVNKDYTITVFMNSECTEDLLNQGYFKIDSKELQKSIANEFGVNETVIFTVFITYNLKSHFRYYDEELNYLDTSIKNNAANNIDYIITNKFTRSISEILGSIVSSLVENEKLNLFERGSDVFNDYCQNITLLGIDIPLKQRLLFLYLHDYSIQTACLGKDCIIEEYNLDESLATCKCKMGNRYEDILKKDKYKQYDGQIEKVNNFVDSIGIIKCTGNGFNSKNMKANPGLFLTLIGMAAQIILFLYYILFSKAVILPKGISNPPKKAIMLITDWDKSIKKTNETEGEVYIQSRDDDNEQLVEE